MKNETPKQRFIKRIAESMKEMESKTLSEKARYAWKRRKAQRVLF